jgi:hypothetical protein
MELVRRLAGRAVRVYTVPSLAQEARFTPAS